MQTGIEIDSCMCRTVAAKQLSMVSGTVASPPRLTVRDQTFCQKTTGKGEEVRNEVETVSDHLCALYDGPEGRANESNWLMYML